MNILKSDFYACRDGEVYPQTFPAGSICPAELVDVAKSLGLIEAKSVKAAPENKAIRNAPENKGKK